MAQTNTLSNLKHECSGRLHPDINELAVVTMGLCVVGALLIFSEPESFNHGICYPLGHVTPVGIVASYF